MTFYVERDIRTLLNVKDLAQFQLFVKMCASRTGQLLNLSALAADCGITHNTAKAWIGVLETSGIVYVMHPYYRNYGKRLVKSPKLHFLDPGLVCRLLGIRDREQLFINPLRGNIFESFIVSELLKHRLNAGLPADLYSWADNIKTEVDALIEDGSRIAAIEIKSGQTILPEFFNGLKNWIKYSGSPAKDCYLVYAGNIQVTQQDMHIISWDRTAEIECLTPMN
ncbi:MAG: DUF4143 domain-containing protein [Treponema sp.]|nr:DUF4143 domain-containing protein [Treponema sp.]